MTTPRGLFFLVCLSVLCLHAPSGAQEENAGPLLCAPTTAVDCLSAADCKTTTAQELNLPLFIRVDLDKKTLTGEREKGALQTSAIKQLQRDGDRIVFQGIENGRSWGIVINGKDRQLVATVTDDQEGFVVFGTCTWLAQWQDHGTP